MNSTTVHWQQGSKRCKFNKAPEDRVGLCNIDSELADLSSHPTVLCHQSASSASRPFSNDCELGHFLECLGLTGL